MSPCPYCEYEHTDGKMIDPLSTQRDRNIHKETHRAERNNLKTWLESHKLNILDAGAITIGEILAGIERGDHV